MEVNAAVEERQLRELQRDERAALWLAMGASRRWIKGALLVQRANAAGVALLALLCGVWWPCVVQADGSQGVCAVCGHRCKDPHVHMVLGKGEDGAECTGAAEVREKFIAAVRNVFVVTGQLTAWGLTWGETPQPGSIHRLAFLLTGGRHLRAVAANAIPVLFALTWGEWAAQERARRAA